uniref:C2 NT-type domain-containing protein n=1 Tax=Kalanchoe fedtschenkoi TaxID=63787 RepID=A0A7N0TQU6_KALFE
MVVNMIKWRPLASRKFEVRLLVKKLVGLGASDEMGRLTAVIKWKGSKMIGLSSLRGVKRNQTAGAVFDDDGALQWNEEFRNFCSFMGFKDNGLHSWEVVITVLNGLSQDIKNKAFVVGSASLNLCEYVSSSPVKELEVNVPLTLTDGSKGPGPLLMLSLSLVEVKPTHDSAEPVCGPAGIIISSSKSALSPEKETVTTPRKGRKKANLFKGCVTAPKLEISYLQDEKSVGKCSNKSKVNESKFDFDTDSVEDLHEDGFSDEGQEEISMLMSPLSYGPLTYVNFGHTVSSYNSDVDDWIYYSNRTPHAESSLVNNAAASIEYPSVGQIPKHRFLSWRKRKLGLRSTRPKGEPLLKKDCHDEGGDDIDFDRRQLTSSDESSFGWHKTEDGSTTSRSSFSEFEDEGFSVGIWEQKKITSREGHMKLETKVFFASMDQRSERAAGESACTALVAVIAEWLQSNRCEMPNKSEFDRLIRDGSSEWRYLCENQGYMERFPDKHFDLETVLNAKIRPLSVAPEKSFIGFFHPEGIVEESCFDILHGSMSFDEIWDEISCQATECNGTSDPSVYIVSWNDHFFILKVEQDAYYIIDTLGERLFEGCNQAYILKFDGDTTIKQILKEPEETCTNQKVQPDKSPQVSKSRKPKNKQGVSQATDEKLFQKEAKGSAENGLVMGGKNSCMEYIKSFLAAIPIRQLQTDIKKGITATSLHQRLQIEFHFINIMA